MKKLKSAHESVFDHLPVCLFLVKKDELFILHYKTNYWKDLFIKC